ncbi:DUF4256 domain-containing protein [Planococcus sp. ISL-109]|uniref:DUF4256 domain-containing protein n=1 Tax=Planococcus sp. ISL-109 TaxID=2819166 RepID=UPI001BEBFE02|nr:DUF4256 domain-containing protein [Planococcus sp. ISL-109]MBT2583342.1 DUF4256 domain-containing protein [Planococcus sp. ISL-109]
MKTNAKQLTEEQRNGLLDTLKERFEQNDQRHEKMAWDNVLLKLDENPEKLWYLHQMEETGGEPDVIGYEVETGLFLFCDCAKESPKGRRSVCYDQKALESRKHNKPKTSAVEMAAELGIELLNEEQYRLLQTLDEFDLKTSNWLETPDEIREHGGAIFGDRRYDQVFVYHNGADSYYAARGFRGILKV